MVRDRVRRRLQRVALRVKRKINKVIAPEQPISESWVSTDVVVPDEPVVTAPVVEEPVEPEEAHPPITRQQVLELFDDMVRPALQADGGDIDLVLVDGNDVHVRLTGACSGCPSSTITMKMGIERLLREEFTNFGELIQVP